MTMITPSYLGETIEYSSLHACRSTLEDPRASCIDTSMVKTGHLPVRLSAAMAAATSFESKMASLMDW